MFDVSHDAGDLVDGRTGAFEKSQFLADRIDIAKIEPGGGFVQQCDLSSAYAIAVGEGTPQERRNPICRKIIGGDGRQVDLRIGFRTRSEAGYIDQNAAIASIQRGHAGPTGVFHSGHLVDGIHDLGLHGQPSRAAVQCTLGCDIERENVLAREAEIDRFEAAQTVNEQRGSPQQHHGQRDLQDYKRTAEALGGAVSRNGPGTALQAGCRVDANRANRGQNSKRQSGEGGNGEREEQNPGVQGKIEDNLLVARGEIGRESGFAADGER